MQDLADAALPAILAEAGTGLDIGVLVYNAAFIPVGRFVDLEQEALEQLVRVNVQGPVTVLRTLLPAMVARRRGAVVVDVIHGCDARRAADCRIRGEQGVQRHARRRSLGRVA